MTRRVEHATTRFDALARALAPDRSRAGTCVELVSGAGQFTGLLGEIFGPVLTVNISGQIPVQAPADLNSPIPAVATALPIATGSLAAAVCVDVVPYPSEIRRVLRADGVLAWVNRPGAESSGSADIPPLIDALGGGWSAADFQTRWGRWTVLRSATVAM